MKRFVVLFLVLLLFTTMAFAESTDTADVSWWDVNRVQTKKLPLQVSDKYIYAELPDGTIAIVLYFGDEKTADIAASFPGKTISSISDHAFDFGGAYGYVSYEINDKKYQYSSDKKLTRIKLPDTIKYLGDNWRVGVVWDHYIDYNIPKELKYVGSEALDNLVTNEVPYFHNVIFEQGYQLKGIRSDILTFAPEYKKIPAYWCTWPNANLIKIPEGIEVIEEGALAFLDLSLKGLELPQTLTKIENDALTGRGIDKWTPELKITLPDALQYIGKNVLSRTNIKKLTIPANLKNIDNTAFAECPLTNLTFSEGTTSITTKAFSDNNQLATLNLPTTLTTIGERCFLRSGLTKLVIPANVTTIGEAAFKNSEKLKDITLPASLTSIADDAFDGCDPKAVFTVFVDTYAEQWVKEHGYRANVLKPVTNIFLNESDLTVNKGKTIYMKAKAEPADATNKKLIWSSSDKAVATVSSSGEVITKGTGECDIICEAADGSGTRATCHITVIRMVSSIETKKQKVTLQYGETYTNEVTILPKDATNTALTWVSSDETVCAVDADGVITAVGAGECQITVTTTDGSNKSKNIKVYVP